MEEAQPTYKRESADRRFAVWYRESWYYGHHYRFYSYSPWHTCGNGMRYDSEAAARAAIDAFMEKWVPRVLPHCRYCERADHLSLCALCGCTCCPEHAWEMRPEVKRLLGVTDDAMECAEYVWK